MAVVCGGSPSLGNFDNGNNLFNLEPPNNMKKDKNCKICQFEQGHSFECKHYDIEEKLSLGDWIRKFAMVYAMSKQTKDNLKVYRKNGKWTILYQDREFSLEEIINKIKE